MLIGPLCSESSNFLCSWRMRNHTKRVQYTHIDTSMTILDEVHRLDFCKTHRLGSRGCFLHQCKRKTCSYSPQPVRWRQSRYLDTCSLKQAYEIRLCIPESFICNNRVMRDIQKAIWNVQNSFVVHFRNKYQSTRMLPFYLYTYFNFFFAVLRATLIK